MTSYDTQVDHTADNVKFPDGSQHSSTALGMLSVTHIMPVLVLLSVVWVGMQQCMNHKHILRLWSTKVLSQKIIIFQETTKTELQVSMVDFTIWTCQLWSDFYTAGIVFISSFYQCV